MSSLINILSQLSAPPSIICIQEIWSSHANLSIPGYHPIELYSRDMDTMANPNCGGGVGIYIRKDIEFKVVTVKNSIIKGVLESFWVKIVTKSGKNYIIGNCYRPNTAPLACVSNIC